MIRKLYREHFKSKFFNRILVTYSAIIVAFALGLAFMASKNISMSIISKEEHYNEQVLNSIDSYLQHRLTISKNLIQQIYINHSLHTEVSYLINNGFEKHIEYKLDKFSSSNQHSYTGFESIFKSTMSCYNDIVSIGLYSSIIDMVFVYSNTFKTVHPESFFPEQLTAIPQSLDRKIFPCHITQYLPHNKRVNVFTIIYPIMDRYSSNSLGLLAIDFDSSALDNIIKGQSEFSGSVHIIDNDGKCIYVYEEEGVNKVSPLDKTSKGDTDGIIMIKSYEDKEISVLVTTPIHILNEKISTVTKAIHVISVLFIFGAIIFSYVTIKGFSSNFKIVLDGFKNVKNGNLLIRIPLTSKRDELSEISASFNSMCDRLNQYIKKVYLSEIKQKNAQIKALQAQINPHFLYNTLEAIRMKSVVYGAEEVGEMIYLLSELFRSSIKGDTILSIREELEYSKMYMDLFNLQYMDNVNVEIHASEDVLDFTIIKHTIQPLIENCIKHGLDLWKMDNKISIKILKDADEILIYVSDNGKGINKEKLDELKRSLESAKSCIFVEDSSIIYNGMGLSNINERIKLIYGEKYGIDINGLPKNGVKITIRIPAKTKDDSSSYDCNCPDI